MEFMQRRINVDATTSCARWRMRLSDLQLTSSSWPFYGMRDNSSLRCASFVYLFIFNTFSSCYALHVFKSQRANDVGMTHQRQSNVVSTSCARLDCSGMKLWRGHFLFMLTINVFWVRSHLDRSGDLGGQNGTLWHSKLAGREPPGPYACQQNETTVENGFISMTRL